VAFAGKTTWYSLGISVKQTVPEQRLEKCVDITK
jgi:hypothetical protein